MKVQVYRFLYPITYLIAGSILSLQGTKAYLGFVVIFFGLIIRFYYENAIMEVYSNGRQV